MTRPHINVTPLIDVLLVLLIIFMVITPTKPSAFVAKIPQEPKKNLATVDPLTLVVIVSSDLRLRLNKDELGSVDDPKALIEELASIFDRRTENLISASEASSENAGQSQKTVFIKAPRDVTYGNVAKVVDAVKGSGANPISLQIDDLE